MTRRRRWCIRAIVAVVLAAAGLRFAVGPPNWFSPPAGEAAATLAERFEYRLLQEMQRVRPPGTQWTIRFDDGAVNAWLALRGPAWAGRLVAADENAGDFAGAADLDRVVVQVRTRRNGIDVAGRSRGGLLRPAFRTRLGAARAAAPSPLHRELEAVRVGRVGLPARWFIRDDEASEALGDPATWLASRGWPAPHLPLADGRTVDVVNLGYESRAFTVTFRTPE